MKNEKLFMILAYPILILVALVFVVFVCTPILLYAFPQMHKIYVADAFVIKPHDASALKKLGVESIYITSGSSTITILHFKRDSEKSEQTIDLLKKPGHKIILYFRGNTADKTFVTFDSFARMLISKINNVQLVSFDYKGFGNAAGEMTKSGAIEDTRTVYQWLKRHAPDNEIHFWAHGMGCSIATAALEEILKGGDEVKSIILEAPYYNSFLMQKKFWVADLYSHILPEHFFTKSLDVLDLNFNTTKSLANVNVPALVLSGEYDDIVDASDVRKLVKDARRHRDFLFHVEWSCDKVKHFPGDEAPTDLTPIIKGFHYATRVFWAPDTKKVPEYANDNEI